jgi:hypothetical protein
MDARCRFSAWYFEESGNRRSDARTPVAIVDVGPLGLAAAANLAKGGIYSAPTAWAGEVGPVCVTGVTSGYSGAPGEIRCRDLCLPGPRWRSRIDRASALANTMGTSGFRKDRQSLSKVDRASEANSAN